MSLKRRVQLLGVVGFAAVAMALSVPRASAAVAVVGSCPSSGFRYPTIQGAITASPAGSTIKICPGTYPEQLTINKNLTIIGIPSGTPPSQSDAVIITSPSGGLTANSSSLFDGSPIAAHVLVDSTTPLGPVNITNVIVDSANNNINACAPELIGIYYRNSGGTLNHVVTRNQFVGAENDSNLNGCQTGLGIFAQSGNGGTSKLNVQYSSVHDYQKNGITGNEVGTTLNAVNNDVTGQGPTTGAAENGIQVGFGAAGSLSGNLVIDDIWAPDVYGDTGNAAAGILLYDQQSGTTVKSNTVGNTQYGIVLVSDTDGEGDGATVQGNRITATHLYDGIDVCSNGNSILSNMVTNSGEADIRLDASCGGGPNNSPATGNSNTVQKNTLSESPYGILKDSGTSGNSVGPNTFYTVVTTDPAGTPRRVAVKPSRP